MKVQIVQSSTKTTAAGKSVAINPLDFFKDADSSFKKLLARWLKDVKGKPLVDATSFEMTFLNYFGEEYVFAAHNMSSGWTFELFSSSGNRKKNVIRANFEVPQVRGRKLKDVSAKFASDCRQIAYAIQQGVKSFL